MSKLRYDEENWAETCLPFLGVSTTYYDRFYLWEMLTLLIQKRKAPISPGRRCSPMMFLAELPFTLRY
jgi:hypothetical protein